MAGERKQDKKDPFGVENVRIVQEDMKAEMRETVLATAKQALTAFYHGEHRYYHDVARSIKATLDKDVGGTWHVIVGRSYGCDISCEVGKLLYFFLGSVCFLVYQHG